LLLLLLAPGRSESSCGDYVRGGKDSHLMLPTGESPLPTPGVPCDGPSCRSHDFPVAPPTPPAPRNAADDWNLTLELPHHTPPGFAGRLAFVDCATSVERPADIFHPPRQVHA